MDERLRCAARRLAGEPMAEICREFAISRKTGYKIFDRYKECGVQGLTDRSQRPYRYAHQLPFQAENYILNVKREHTTWEARKIRERLIPRFSGIKIPAKSTIHAVLDRHGLVERRGRLRHRARGTSLSLGQKPNELVGIKEVHDNVWLVSFMDYDLGCFDLETRVLEPLDNPFGPRLLRM